MKKATLQRPGFSFDANPRFYDRLMAVCSFLLALGLLAALYLILQPDMNPPARMAGFALNGEKERQAQIAEETRDVVVESQPSA